jgi:hypothetical protein
MKTLQGIILVVIAVIMAIAFAEVVLFAIKRSYAKSTDTEFLMKKYEGHFYVTWKSGGVVHSPDCPCLLKR